MSESLMSFAEALYQTRNPLTGEFDRVSFDQQRFGVTYGRTQDGYFVVQTGNAVRDAVVSVFLNEVGIDNFSNAISAFKGGSYGEAAKQSLYGVAQAGLTLIPGVNVLYAKTRGAMLAARAAGGVGRALGGRLLNAPAGARYALNRVTNLSIPQAARSLIPRYGSTARQLRLGRQQGLQITPTGFRGPTTVQTGMGAPASLTPPAPAGQLSFPATVSGVGPVPAPALRGSALERQAMVRRGIKENMRAARTTPGAPAVWNQRARYLLGFDPIPGVVTGTGTRAAAFGAGRIGRGMSSPVLAGAGRAGVPATAGWLAMARSTQAQAQEETEGRNAAAAIASEADAADRARASSVDDQIRAAIAEIEPGGSGDQAVADVESSYNATVATLNFQYDKAVNELRSMYQLAETEDEKSRLRFILSDIQAQHEAGQRAINNVFERKRAEVQRLTQSSRENSVLAAQKAFDLYEVSANQLKDMLETSRRQMADEVYGFGAAAPRDQSEYVQLLSAMAPVAQQSRQAIGDIGTEGLEWLGAVMGEQTAARGADLQRLAMSTRAAAISQHQKQVDDRVNAERMALAQAVQSLRERQASESGAMQRAMLGQAEQQEMFSPVDVQGIVEAAVQRTGSVERAIEQYRVYIAGKPNPLGGVYPMQPPDFVLKAIRDTKTRYDALMEYEDAQLAFQRQEQMAAQGAITRGVPGAE
jgi:hypothetical protein